jgi:hypothetical protein
LAIGLFADDKVKIEVGHSNRLLRCRYAWVLLRVRRVPHRKRDRSASISGSLLHFGKGFPEAQSGFPASWNSVKRL